jgi:hypothetical protein
MADFGDLQLGKRLCLERLRGNLTGSQIRGDLAIDIAGFQLGLIRVNQALDEGSNEKGEDCHPHVSRPFELFVTAR